MALARIFHKVESKLAQKLRNPLILLSFLYRRWRTRWPTACQDFGELVREVRCRARGGRA